MFIVEFNKPLCKSVHGSSGGCFPTSYRINPHGEALIFNDLGCSLTGPGFHGLFVQSGVAKNTLARIIAAETSGYEGEVTSYSLTNILYSSNTERLPAATLHK